MTHAVAHDKTEGKYLAVMDISSEINFLYSTLAKFSRPACVRLVLTPWNLI